VESRDADRGRSVARVPSDASRLIEICEKKYSNIKVLRAVVFCSLCHRTLPMEDGLYVFHG